MRPSTPDPQFHRDTPAIAAAMVEWNLSVSLTKSREREGTRVM
jgi:hypothetical protein